MDIMNMRLTALSILILTILPCTSQAQIKEINPNVQWTFVKSQELNALDGQLYEFEFPIERGYDYVISLNHGMKGASVSLKILDMQLKPIADYKTESSDDVLMYEFDVPHNATYMVYYVIKSTEQGSESFPLELNIVRRMKT